MNSKNVFSSSEATAGACADYIIHSMNFHISSKQKFSLAVSGGTTPKLLFKILAEKYSLCPGWVYTNIFWVDERCVPQNNPESNFGQAKQILFDNLSMVPKLFPIDGAANPDDEASRYSKLIQDTIAENGEIPSLDLVILGIGDDGHTASIFPDDENGFSTKELVTIGHHPVTQQTRITMSAKLLAASKEIIFLVTGKSKAETVRAILVPEQNGNALPAYRIEQLAKCSLWYLDTDAAILI